MDVAREMRWFGAIKKAASRGRLGIVFVWRVGAVGLVDLAEDEVEHRAPAQPVVGLASTFLAALDEQRATEARDQVFEHQGALVVPLKHPGVGRRVGFGCVHRQGLGITRSGTTGPA